MLLLSCFIYFKFQMKECLCVIMPALLNLTFTSHREFAHLVHLLKKKKKETYFHQFYWNYTADSPSFRPRVRGNHLLRYCSENFMDM